jgi:DNA-binding MarR family transcriptional regulator
MQRQLNQISESALLLFPLLRILVKEDPDDPPRVPFKNLSYHVLRLLERKGPLPVSAIGKQLAVAKQNMTKVIDKLNDQGLVERRSDPKDRRIVSISLTEIGRVSLKESRAVLKKIIKKNLAELSGEDIRSLDSAFQTIRSVVSKLKKEERAF